MVELFFTVYTVRRKLVQSCPALTEYIGVEMAGTQFGFHRPKKQVHLHGRKITIFLSLKLI